MGAEVRVAYDAGALVLTLSNPGLRNALAPEMYEALLPAFERAAADPGVHCVIVTGADGFFCAGGNLNRLLANRSQPRQVQQDSIAKLHSMVRALAACPKPVIAAVEGAAAGAGLSLALGCDMIVASTSAKFVMSYVQVGLSPDGGGSWLASHALPRQIASQMLLMGEPFTSARLYDLGLVNEVVSDGLALSSALNLASRLEKLSSHAIARIKGLMVKAASSSFDAHLDAERDAFVDCLHHPDAGVAIEAFLSKRSKRN
jgi:enoyl-CoA hydratase/carnithine racemase